MNYFEGWCKKLESRKIYSWIKISNSFCSTFIFILGHKYENNYLKNKYDIYNNTCRLLIWPFSNNLKFSQKNSENSNDKFRYKCSLKPYKCFATNKSGGKMVGSLSVLLQRTPISTWPLDVYQTIWFLLQRSKLSHISPSKIIAEKFITSVRSLYTEYNKVGILIASGNILSIFTLNPLVLLTIICVSTNCKCHRLQSWPQKWVKRGEKSQFRFSIFDSKFSRWKKYGCVIVIFLHGNSSDLAPQLV